MRRTIIFLLLVLGGLISMSLPSYAQLAVRVGDKIPYAETQLQRKIQVCADSHQSPCVITECEGGLIADALKAAAIIVSAQIRVVFAGTVHSSCVLMADKSRPYSFITKEADIGLHQSCWFGWDNDKDVPTTKVITKITCPNPQGSELPDTADVQRWARTHHAYGSTTYKKMSVSDARKFWQVWQGKIPEQTALASP